MILTKTLSTFNALEFTAANIHMWTHVLLQANLTGITFSTLTTWIRIFSSMFWFVNTQCSFSCKPSVTHCTQIRSWLVIMWMLSDIITISFNPHLYWTFTCNTSHRVGFLPRQKVFLPGQWKKPVKTTVKTDNKFSTLNWIEILRCNYNASLNH